MRYSAIKAIQEVNRLRNEIAEHKDITSKDLADAKRFLLLASVSLGKYEIFCLANDLILD